MIANTTSADFRQINATVAGKKDMEEVVNAAKDNMGMYGKKTILFVDEIHRFNKSQQDYLLPFVEDGTLILIGATTDVYKRQWLWCAPSISRESRWATALISGSALIFTKGCA